MAPPAGELTDTLLYRRSLFLKRFVCISEVYPDLFRSFYEGATKTGCDTKPSLPPVIVGNVSDVGILTYFKDMGDVADMMDCGVCRAM